MATQIAANHPVPAARILLNRWIDQAGEVVERRRRDVGDRIRDARKEAGMAQKDLAAAVHVETMTVSRWERAAHVPSLDMIRRIAEVTGRPLAFFLTEAVDVTLDPPLPGDVPSLQSLQEELRDVKATLARIESRLAGQGSARSVRQRA